MRAGESYESVLADYGLVMESAYNDLLGHALVLLDCQESGHPDYREAATFVEERRSLLPLDDEAKS